MSTKAGMGPDGGASRRAQDAHAQAILDAALDAVLTIDHTGHVLEFNRAAEQMFGYRKSEVLGRELAELIVPPELRDAHRGALARWTESGPGPGAGGLLGRRIEVEALRGDGSRFPAELAISRVDVPGSPVFTACIRDVTTQNETQGALRRTEFRFRTLVEQLPLISYVDSSDNPSAHAHYISPQIEQVLGYTVEEWLTTPDLFESSIHEDDRERVLAQRRDVYARGEELRCEFRIRSKSGDVVWLEDRSVVVEPPDGHAFRQGFAVDITERRNAEAAHRRAESRFRMLVEQLPLAVYIDRLDESSSNIYTSPQIEPMLGFTREEWVADKELFVSVLHPDDRERVLAAHARVHATGEPLEIEYRVVARDGRVVWVHDAARAIPPQDGGEPVLQGYLLDVTARKEAEEQLRHQAFHDALTGLANRALFTDRVEHALVVRSDSAREVTVLILDLDDFKSINDSFGHPAGDALLVAIAARLRAVLSESHTVARLGGDEFAVLVEGSTLSAAADVAERLLGELEAPFDLDGRHVFVSASIGIAVGANSEELMRSADIALYQAKASGGAQYVVYASRMGPPASDRLELVADLRRACVEDEFVVHYQPIVELTSGRLVGVEALVRWQHPRRGLLQPLEFIQLAEETGRIVDIGSFVLTEACRQAAAWKAMLPRGTSLSLSVNVSKRQVRSRELLSEVEAALAGCHLAPSELLLEITESVFADGRAELPQVLEEVASLGVSFALDDFGKGYSSLSLLQDLPVQVLKIDRYFVGAIGTGLERTAFVRAIVELARALGLDVVAEGIENAAHVAVLRQLGCRVGQGFHYAPPLPADELEKLFEEGVVPRFPRAVGTPRVKVA